LIVVRLERNAGNLTFTVEDDGRGIDAATVRTSQTGGQDQLGIQGITERANLIGGQLQITSRSGQGTRVDLIVPLASRPVQGAPQAR
jgi:signal transduction histidine kinase